MPGMEGLETIQKFRRHYPDLKIIAISGGGLGNADDYLEMARKFGAHRTVAKPFSVTNLSNIAAEVLQEN
jgi:DNA-binding NtrC family response regulator